MVDDVSSEQVKDVLAKTVETLEGNVEYGDLLFDKAEGVSIRKDKAEERVSSPAAIQGVVLRAYKLGQWREISVNDLSDRRMKEAAHKLSRFQPLSKNSIRLDELKPWKLDGELDVKIRPSEVETEEKLEHVRRLYNDSMSCDKRIINTVVTYSDTTQERIFANTEGSLLRQTIPRTSLILVPIAKQNGKMDYDYLNRGGTVGFELLKDLEEETVRETVNSSTDLLKASTPPSGHFTVILDPGMTGIFAHESFGHGCEADQIVRRRSYLASYNGKRVGFDELNICDDGTLLGGNGSFLFDDEGIKSRKNYIVQNGVLRGFLHERYSASLMSVEPTGNGRRENFLRRLFVRMTNTYIEPGDYNLDEMIEDIDEGVMLVHGVSGMEDPLAGGMELKSKRGYMIEKGRLTKVFSTLTLTENVLDFLPSIDAVGKKDQFGIVRGNCGKGHEDLVPIAGGGVYVRAKAVVSQG